VCRIFFGKVWVNVSSQGLRLRRRVLLAGCLVAVPLAAVSNVEVKPSNAWQVNSQAARENPQNVVRIQAGAKALSFGETLSEPERSWLCDTIRREVAILRG
jgi:hypothetical protein